MSKNVKRVNMKASEFYCTECGKRGIDIIRRKSKARSSGHLKRLWCPYCKKEINFVEISPFGGKYTYETFKKEYFSGRFVDGNRIPLDELERCKEECPYSIQGKCWNANKNYECSKRRAE